MTPLDATTFVAMPVLFAFIAAVAAYARTARHEARSPDRVALRLRRSQRARRLPRVQPLRDTCDPCDQPRPIALS